MSRVLLPHLKGRGIIIDPISKSCCEDQIAPGFITVCGRQYGIAFSTIVRYKQKFPAVGRTGGDVSSPLENQEVES